MLFGTPEMKEFAESSDDPRIKAMWNQIQQSRSNAAKWSNAGIKDGQKIAALQAAGDGLAELVDMLLTEVPHGTQETMQAALTAWEQAKEMR